mgnify:CR=1 FL=1
MKLALASVLSAVLLAGHVEVGSNSFLGGGAVFHQFLRIGDYCMIQGNSSFGTDVPHYCAGFRTNLLAVFIISILVNIGMWFERFVIIVISLHRDFLPSNWAYYLPSPVDILTYLGTFGLFFTLFLLFMRFLPMIAISEVKGVTPFADPHTSEGGAKGGHH